LKKSKDNKMKVKEIIEEHKKGRRAVRHNPKPRNPVAHASQSVIGGSASGAHKDKKKAEKQGDVKHKLKQFKESVTEGPLELNTPNPVVVIQDLKGKILDKLNLSVAAQKYKLGQPQDIKKQLAHQNYTTIGNYVIVAPMSGQPQDKTTQGVAEGESQHSDMSIAQDVYAENPDLDSEDDILNAAFPHVVKMMGGNKKRANYMFNYDEDFPGEMITAYKWLQRQAHDVGEDITMERDRDPEDWDEGNTEPPNNFAVYINGKKWKVFAGRGTYADDYREKAHYQQLRAWADKKSAATGKQWTVSPTGEPATA
jgi:hypothetical protein